RLAKRYKTTKARIWAKVDIEDPEYTLYAGTAPVVRWFHELLAGTPQVLEAHYVTGEDCFLLKVVARSMPDLEHVAGRFLTFGRGTTNLLFSSPLPPSADDDVSC
ncbi:Lrp/AsnC ligand binding domain-containing protein, partial [Kibdelosporangium lantanae]